MRRTLQWFFIFLFLLAVGIASGSFFEVFLYGAGKASLAETLNIFLTTPQEMLNVFPYFLRPNMSKSDYHCRSSSGCSFRTASFALFSTAHFRKGIQLRLHRLHDV